MWDAGSQPHRRLGAEEHAFAADLQGRGTGDHVNQVRFGMAVGRVPEEAVGGLGRQHGQAAGDLFGHCFLSQGQRLS